MRYYYCSFYIVVYVIKKLLKLEDMTSLLAFPLEFTPLIRWNNKEASHFVALG